MHKYGWHTVRSTRFSADLAEPATAAADHERGHCHSSPTHAAGWVVLLRQHGGEQCRSSSPSIGIPPMPQHLLKTIKQGKFVDLPDLLPEALREAQFTKVRESKDEAKKRRHTITSPLDWMAAFSSYMAVAVHLKPQRAFELVGYTSIVSNLAREGRGQA